MNMVLANIANKLVVLLQITSRILSLQITQAQSHMHAVLFSFFGVHPLRMTTTSSSTLKTQHEEENPCANEV